jgi:hypothetical protein
VIYKMTGSKVTQGKQTCTFHVEKDTLQKIYNYAYWDRLSITEAINGIINDGLVGKTIKPIPKK